jgi:type VI protein secretion system component VasK
VFVHVDEEPKMTYTATSGPLALLLASSPQTPPRMHYYCFASVAATSPVWTLQWRTSHLSTRELRRTRESCSASKVSCAFMNRFYLFIYLFSQVLFEEANGHCHMMVERERERERELSYVAKAKP